MKLLLQIFDAITEHLEVLLRVDIFYCPTQVHIGWDNPEVSACLVHGISQGNILTHDMRECWTPVPMRDRERRGVGLLVAVKHPNMISDCRKIRSNIRCQTCFTRSTFFIIDCENPHW
jgi:hypothetical protein